MRHMIETVAVFLAVCLFGVVLGMVLGNAVVMARW